MIEAYINAMPEEIFYNILEFMTASDLRILCGVNRRFNLLSNDDRLWKTRLITFNQQLGELLPIAQFEKRALESKAKNFWKKEYFELMDGTKAQKWIPYGRYSRNDLRLLKEAAAREVKTVVCGYGGTGKSALVIQFIQSHFIDEYDPTIEDSYRKMITLPGVSSTSVLIDLLDTAGQEEYSAMRDQYMGTGEGFLLVYSITSRESYFQVPKLISEVLRVKKKQSIPLVIVANKADLVDERQVLPSEGIALAKKYNCPFFQTSAKDFEEVFEVFVQLVFEIAYYRTYDGQVPNYPIKKEERRCGIM